MEAGSGPNNEPLDSGSGSTLNRASPDSDSTGVLQGASNHYYSTQSPTSTVPDIFQSAMQEKDRSIVGTNCHEALVTGFRAPSFFDECSIPPPNMDLVEICYELQVTFATLVELTTDALQRKNVDARRLKSFLTTLHRARKENASDHEQQALNDATQVSDVIDYFSRIGAWDFLNFLLLITLIGKYECNGIEEDLAMYRAQIEGFKKTTKLRDFLVAWSGRSSVKEEMQSDREVVDLMVKVEGTWPDFTLAQVSKKEGYMADEFRVRQSVLQLRNAKSGCVWLVWVIPLSVAELMTKILLERKPDLIKGGILQLAIKGKIHYKASTCPWRGETYASLYQKSLEDPDQFWGGMAARYLQWEGIFDTVSADCDMEKGVIKWFTGGKLNVSVNCLDRHVDEDPNRIALIWEKNEPGQEERYTYQELLTMTCRVAGVLKSHGVKKGHEVIIYLPPCPLAVASMLACARIGAVHIVVSSQIDTDGLQKRIECANARVVITAVSYKLGHEELHLKEKIDVAVTDDTIAVLVSVENELVTTLREQDVNLEEAMEKQKDWCSAELMDSEDRLFIMYTSGTSDPSPTGIVHSQAGYLLYVAMTHQFVFDYRPGEVFACDTDLGWITGHSYVVYGPLCNGGTTVLFGSKATYPDADRYWKMVDRLKVKHLYSTPGTLGELMKAGDRHVTPYNLSSLRNLGTVGEPIKPKLWKWYHSMVGRGQCSILDTWWQTETGGIAIVLDPPEKTNPVPSRFPPGPFFGVAPFVDVMTDEHKENNIKGMLYLSKPLPAMCRDVFGKEKSTKDYYGSSLGYCTSDIVQQGSMGGFHPFHAIARKRDAIRINDQHLDIPKLEDQMEMSDSQIVEATLIERNFDSEGPGTMVLMEVVGPDPLSLPERRKLVVKARSAVDETEKSDFLDAVVFVDYHPRTFNGKVLKYALREATNAVPWELVGDTTTKDGTYFKVIQEKKNLMEVHILVQPEG